MWCCYNSQSKVIINEIHDIIKKNYAEKYGISIERYNRIFSLPNMTYELMETMHRNGYDFADTKLDLELFATMQTFPNTNVLN